MASPNAVSIVRELGIRESGQSGRWPYLAQEIMRHHILPVARTLGITKRIGWHTFRHTYWTLLRSTGAELKIMQELLRHSTIRVTLDTYTQAVTTEKRNAQEAVVALLFPEKTQETQALSG
jgi:integrase